MIKMKDKLMVQDIRTHVGQYCWKRLHKKARETSMKDFGFTWFMKAATRKESNIARITMDLYVIHELFRDTLVVFQ